MLTLNAIWIANCTLSVSVVCKEVNRALLNTGEGRCGLSLIFLARVVEVKLKVIHRTSKASLIGIAALAPVLANVSLTAICRLIKSLTQVAWVEDALVSVVSNV